MGKGAILIGENHQIQIQIQIQTQIQIHKYKYTNTNTQIQIHKYKSLVTIYSVDLEGWLPLPGFKPQQTIYSVWVEEDGEVFGQPDNARHYQSYHVNCIFSLFSFALYFVFCSFRNIKSVYL